MSWPSTVTLPLLALTMPQMMLMSVVLPAHLAAADVQREGLQGLEAGGVGLRNVGDLEDVWHVPRIAAGLAAACVATAGARVRADPREQGARPARNVGISSQAL